MKENDKLHNKQEEPAMPDNASNELDDAAEQAEEVDAEEVEAEEAEPSPEERIAQLEAELAKQKNDYLYLMAEFDNFRKRTVKDKAELLRNGGENAMKLLLPIIDDFERALEAIDKADDVAAVKEGTNLIYNKFVKYLEQNGVKEIATPVGEAFDTELHEAVTTFPADDEKLRGCIIDTVQKGYMINDKVLRHAKVVVGQ